MPIAPHGRSDEGGIPGSAAVREFQSTRRSLVPNGTSYKYYCRQTHPVVNSMTPNRIGRARRRFLAEPSLLRRSTVRSAQGNALGKGGVLCGYRPNGPTVPGSVWPVGPTTCDGFDHCPQGAALGWANYRAFGPRIERQEILRHPTGTPSAAFRESAIAAPGPLYFAVPRASVPIKAPTDFSNTVLQVHKNIMAAA
jgi:hypothetical protein